MDRLHFHHAASLIATGSASSVLERAPASTGATDSGVLAQPSRWQPQKPTTRTRSVGILRNGW
jgi:hypothetical protein